MGDEQFSASPGWRRGHGVKVLRNDRGNPIGMSHWNSKLPDASIALILELHDAGLSYGQIAGKFDDPAEPSVSKSMAYQVCQGLKRQHTVDQVRSAQRWIVELHAICRRERVTVPTAAERDHLLANRFPGKTALASFYELGALRARRG